MIKNQINSIIAVILLLASLIFFTASCGGENPTDDANATGNVSNSATVSEIDNSETQISVMTQEYIGENIAEILMISYNGQQPALEEYGWKNPEIDMINNEIKNGIQQTYNEFLESGGEGEWIEIKSYPSTSDEWVQIVTSCAVYPSYGTSVNVESYNFNKKENKRYTIYDAIENEGITEESFNAEVKELFIPQSGGLTLESIKAAGFRIAQGLDGAVTQFFVEITAKNGDGDPWQGIFSYVREAELVEIIGEALIYTPDLDKMDPPLLYQQYMD